jgi:ABC-type sugar transport system permease subunit
MSDTVVTGTKSGSNDLAPSSSGFLSGRRGRQLRENLLAYIFLFPAFLIVFSFGLFPLAFSAYESTLRGLNRILGTYDGLGNYVRAVDNLAYVLGFWMGLVLIFLGVRSLMEARKTASEHGDNPWILALPGAAMGLTIVLLFRFVFT